MSSITHMQDRSRGRCPGVGSYLYAMCGRYDPYLITNYKPEVTCSQCKKAIEKREQIKR
jgi:hypothetical protein